MLRIPSILLILFLAFSSTGLLAQEGTIPGGDAEWIDMPTSMYIRGDRTFNINAGILFPLYFTKIEGNDHGISMGGTGSLAFNYFLSPNWFVGGEIFGSFTGTRGGNMLYLIPVGLKGGYQFVIRQFEFPLSLLIGVAPQRYIEKGYFGVVVMPGASAYWRYSSDFSFGLNTNWWILPQYPKNGHSTIGNFMALTLSVRMHI